MFDFLFLYLALFALGTVSTFFPDADPETTSVDGRVDHNQGSPGGVAWGTLVSGAGTAAVDAGATAYAFYFHAGTTSGNFDEIRRSIFLFDTASIPDADTVDSAILSLSGQSKNDDLAVTPNLNIYSSAPASNTALVAGDYDSLGSTAFSTAITYANLSTTGFNDFALNADGLAQISKTGVSKFGGRNANYDVANVAPAWTSNLDSGFVYYTAEEIAAGDQRPKLVVTHTAPPSAFIPKMLTF